MKNNSPGLAIAIIAAALSSLPLAANAQSPATQPPPQTQHPVTQQPQPILPPPALPPSTPDPAMPPPTAQPPATPPPTGAPGEPAQTQTPAQTTATGGALVLLDRITDLVDQSLGQKPVPKESDKSTPGATGTSGVLKVGKTGAGQVIVDRATLDEIKAEIEQLKIMLKDKQP